MKHYYLEEGIEYLMPRELVELRHDLKDKKINDKEFNRQLVLMVAEEIKTKCFQKKSDDYWPFDWDRSKQIDKLTDEERKDYNEWRTMADDINDYNSLLKRNRACVLSAVENGLITKEEGLMDNWE